MNTEQLAEEWSGGLLGRWGWQRWGTTELAEHGFLAATRRGVPPVTRPAVELYAGRRRAVLPAGTSAEVGHWHVAHARRPHTRRMASRAKSWRRSARWLRRRSCSPAASVSRYLPRVGTEGVARAIRLPFAAVCLREASSLRCPDRPGRAWRYARVRGDDAGRLPTDLAALERSRGGGESA